MQHDTESVVFVGPADLADLTGRTRARIYQLTEAIATPGALLPEGDALVNGNHVFKLDTVQIRMERAGYKFASAKVAALRELRSVPAGTVPVGVDESAEVLGITEEQFRNRVKSGTAPAALFKIGLKRVWDLNGLVADAEARGYPVDVLAADRWRIRNGGTSAPSVNRVSAVIRLDLTVVSLGMDDAVREAQAQLEDPEALKSVLAGHGLHVLAASVESVEASPLG